MFASLTTSSQGLFYRIIVYDTFSLMDEVACMFNPCHWSLLQNPSLFRGVLHFCFHLLIQFLNLLLQKVERLKLICLQYAAAIQRLISSSSSDISTDGTYRGSPEMGKYKQLKIRTRSQTLKLAPESTIVIESIL